MDLFDMPAPTDLHCSVEVDDVASELADAFDFEFDGLLTFSPPAMPDPPEGLAAFDFGFCATAGAISALSVFVLIGWVASAIISLF